MSVATHCEEDMSENSAGPMTSLDAAKAIMRADMMTHRASKRSLGVLYAMVMAGNKCSEPGFWRSINEPIIAYGGGGPIGIRYLDGVKKVAWSIFEEVAKQGAAT